ncbi:MAG TPA: undecaprenyl-diphosphate phosphatase [Moorella mulderi]|nr:undecaprenyl-diphosphate phosphatase [Moorella mulderi]
MVQGITELFPVSSVAHAVLLPAIFSLSVPSEGLLPFTVVLHLGTAAALLIFYWKDLEGILDGLRKNRRPCTKAGVLSSGGGHLAGSPSGGSVLKAFALPFSLGHQRSFFSRYQRHFPLDRGWEKGL